MFCGGTPCQAFSVAGVRRSLDDARGNLSLTFCEIANEIDAARLVRGHEPSIVFWENVPGVLSTKDNAFGCFLAGLAGEDDPVEPPGGKWTNAGCVFGPQRTVAWRILDAQYFGVGQRRRRVFVVASARDGFDPAAVLFEFEGVRRDTAPSREARQEVAGGIEIGPGGGRFTELNPTLDTGAQHGPIRNQLAGAVMHSIVMSSGQANAEIKIDGSVPTLTCLHEEPIALAENTIGRLPHNGGNGDGFTVGGPMYTLNCTGVHGVAQPIPYGVGESPDTAHCLRSGASKADKHESTTYVAQPVAFSAKDYGGDATVDLAPTLRAMPHDGSHANGGGQMAVAQPVGAFFAGQGTNRTPSAHIGMAVRRLTPVECERLQGFPDNYTAIPWRNKPADECPDGPRYKALGNSWAVPVAAWIGRRIDEAIKNVPAAL